jgi:hypothetical protein
LAVQRSAFTRQVESVSIVWWWIGRVANWQTESGLASGTHLVKLLANEGALQMKLFDDTPTAYTIDLPLQIVRADKNRRNGHRRINCGNFGEFLR